MDLTGVMFTVGGRGRRGRQSVAVNIVARSGLTEYPLTVCVVQFRRSSM